MTELFNLIIEFSNSIRELLYMCTIRERANSFATLSNWIRELSNSIKELSNTTNTPEIWKNVGIRELSNCIKELSDSFMDKLN